jgi:ADP-heptose:LPS heptosyltransferase
MIMKILYVNVEPMGIGDTVMATPSMQALRALYPNERIDVIQSLPGLPILPENIFDNIYPFDINFDPSDYDLAVLSTGREIRTANKEMGKRAKEMAFHRNPSHDKRHRIEMSMEAVRDLGYQGPTPREKISYNDVPPEIKSITGNDYSVIHVGSITEIPMSREEWKINSRKTGYRKRWCNDNWIRVVEELSSYGNVISLPGLYERDPVEKISKNSGLISFEVDLPTAAGIIKDAKIVVTTDSGPMHIASALDVPIVALFGPTNEFVYGPYPLSEEKHRIVKSGVSCRPCYATENFDVCGVENHQTPECMENIKPEHVISAIRDLM